MGKRATKLAIAGIALLLVWAPPLAAQLIDCSGGCTLTKYGLGLNGESYLGGADAPGDGCWGALDPLPVRGQIVLREQTSCVTSAPRLERYELVKYPDKS